ncbi:protein kinase [Sorangium sp. So ce367]|uniref:protein kinase domain-containing protein n=1 Tax=Sorangium sp. So ce367 TaxID=3133305 RepID=UPI003F5EB53F
MMLAIQAEIDQALRVQWRNLSVGDRLGPYVLKEPLFVKPSQAQEITVWLAETPGILGSPRVVIKLFHTSEASQHARSKAAKRFWYGASAMSNLEDCPSIAKLRHPPAFSLGHLWFAMDYFPEGNFKNLLDNPRNLTDDDREQIIDDIIAAVEAAHKRNPVVIHRDIRPENILIRKDHGRHRAVLADFDMVYFRHVTLERTTTEGFPLSYYAPPELHKPQSPDEFKKLIRDPANDLYSICMVVFELFVDPPSTLPTDDSLDAFRQLVGASSSALRERVALLCYGGLGPKKSGRRSRAPSSELRDRFARLWRAWLGSTERSAQRYKNIDELREAWTRNPTREWQHHAVTLVLMSWSASLVILADWVWYYCHSALPLRVFMNVLATAFGVAGILALLRWGLDLARGQFPKWRATLVKHWGARTGTLLGIVVVSVALIPAVASKTRLWERVRSYSVQDAEGCEVRDGSGQVIEVIKSRDKKELEGDPEKVCCAEKVEPDISEGSLFSPTLSKCILPTK